MRIVHFFTKYFLFRFPAVLIPATSDRTKGCVLRSVATLGNRLQYKFMRHMTPNMGSPDDSSVCCMAERKLTSLYSRVSSVRINYSEIEPALVRSKSEHLSCLVTLLQRQCSIYRLLFFPHPLDIDKTCRLIAKGHSTSRGTVRQHTIFQ